MTTTAGASKFFPKAQEGFTTTTSGLVASGASTVGLNSTGNYSNGDTVVHIIDPGVSGKEQSFTGVIDTSGVQVTGVVWLSGTNVPHVSGATVVDYVAAGHIDLISAGALVSHDASGNPKAGVTYPTPILTTPTIADFSNATHTHANATGGGQLSGSAIASGAQIIDKTLNPYKFSVYRNAALNAASGFFSSIPFDTKEYDTGSNVDIVTNKGRFTAPIAGFYNFSATGTVTTGAANEELILSLYKNGAEFKRGLRIIEPTSGIATSSSVTATLQLAANDYVEVWEFCTLARTFTVGPVFLYFHGTLVSQT